MYIQSIALLVAGLMATTSIASSLPGPAPVDGLTPISSQKLENGHSVIVYGAGDPHVSRRDDNIEDEDEDELERRQWFGPKKEKYCHVDKTPNCDDKNGGPTELCQELVNQLYGYRERTQPSDARQYCIKGQTEKYCCVKWTKEAKDLTNGDLADAVDTAFKQCTQAGTSAKWNSFSLKSKCLSLCVNNGKGCKDDSVFKT